MSEPSQHLHVSTISSKEIFSLISQGTQLDILLQALTAWVGERLPDALVSVMIYDPETHTLSLHPSKHFTKDYVAALQNIQVTPTTGTCGAAAATQQVVVSSDLSSDPKWQHYLSYANAEGLAACWSTPIVGQRLFGTFATYYRTIKSPTEQDIALIERAASMLALAIEQHNARTMHQTLNERYSSLFNNHPDCVYEMDLKGRIVSANTTVLELTNTTESEVIGLHFSEFVSEPYQARAVAAFNDATRGNTPTHFELEIKTNDGETHWMEITNLPITLHDKVVGVFGIGRDVSSQHQNKDPVTGLPKRRVFEKQLVSEIQQVKQPLRKSIALLSIDLDDFSAVNESIGFHNADFLLAEVGNRLRNLVAANDLVSRFAADEFMVLLRDSDTSGFAMVMADRFLETLSEPFDVNGHRVYVSASIGITTLQPLVEDIQAPTVAMQLLREADLAAAEAKHQGKNTWTVYHGADTGGFSEFALLRQELQTAILKQQFALFYQPLVCSDSFTSQGLEALIRWDHPIHGMQSPDKFIAVAERTGQIVTIGRWVLHQACKDIVSHNRKNGTALSVSVNISPLQFRRNGFVEEVISALHESRLAPSLLTLELTENVLVKGADKTTDILKQIRALGVKVAIDDFGTGYSSLSYLRHLPADYIKIDKSFIRDIECDTKNRAIAMALIQMARQLDLQVVAEGVETVAQAELLASYQCNLLQGFYFARPQHLLSLTDTTSTPSKPTAWVLLL